jgi:hypothetical protein
LACAGSIPQAADAAAAAAAAAAASAAWPADWLDRADRACCVAADAPRWRRWDCRAVPRGPPRGGSQAEASRETTWAWPNQTLNALQMMPAPAVAAPAAGDFSDVGFGAGGPARPRPHAVAGAPRAAFARQTRPWPHAPARESTGAWRHAPHRRRRRRRPAVRGFRIAPQARRYQTLPPAIAAAFR